ncbi:MAG: penicillin-binding protein activator [Pseudomonadota bacterium]
MQRISVLLLASLALYGAAPALASPPQPGPAITAPLAQEQAPPSAAIAPAATPESAEPPVPPAVPHIALLLPLDSAPFGHVADAVREGFIAAASVQGTDLPIMAYPTDENTEKILASYREAIAAGARIVVGPLTRNAVAALAASNLVTVPTLALNALESERWPPQMYMYGLQIESDARQVAQLAYAQGKRKVVVVGTDTALSRRMRQAYADEWKKLGAETAAELILHADNDILPTLREEVMKNAADAVFLALDGEKARTVRSYLDSSAAIYATSQVFSGKTETLANFDLNGVRFVDMPWLVQPDHPAVMIYPRPEMPLSAELERLYAFGIDAFRLAETMLHPPADWDITLDGVTGHIALGRAHQFVRELVPVQLSEGDAVILPSAKP